MRRATDDELLRGGLGLLFAGLQMIGALGSLGGRAAAPLFAAGIRTFGELGRRHQVELDRWADDGGATA